MFIPLLFRINVRQLGSKPKAYRRDYCCTCEAERLSIQWRFFGFLQLWAVPLVPLGFWRVWRCQHCGADPTFRENTWGRLLRLGGFLFGAIALWVTVGIASEALEQGEIPFPVMSALILLGWWSVASLLMVSGRRSLRTEDREEALLELKPAVLEHCELCKASLTAHPKNGGRLVCSACGLERLVA